MQLKVKRGQAEGGVFGGKIFFSLDVRAEYTEEERTLINKYKLGSEVIYSSEASKHNSDKAAAHLDGGSLFKGMGALLLAGMNLNITVASLQKGHHIECKALGELVDAENALVSACRNVKAYLDLATSFDGREVLINVAEVPA